MVTPGKDEGKLLIVSAKEFLWVGYGSLRFGRITSSRSDNEVQIFPVLHSPRARQDLTEVRKIVNTTFSLPPRH